MHILKSLNKVTVTTALGLSLLVVPGALINAKEVVRLEAIQPIPEIEVESKEKVELGKYLWFDPRLSKSGEISCNTCHDINEKAGADDQQYTLGHHRQPGRVNVPTVFNARFNMAQFWDGRAKDLREQVSGPIEDPIEMASGWDFVIQVINAIPDYKSSFEKIYESDEITPEMVSDAIASFEETLVTPNSRFDQWLYGDDDALSEKELSGYNHFKDNGCTTCHHGVNVGSTTFQKIGKMRPYQTSNRYLGREEFTGAYADRYAFKVPTLRNIELTAPYFHDGEMKTLEETVAMMGRLQLGRELSFVEVSDIVAFLKTLTGDLPEIEEPKLPEADRDALPEYEPYEEE